MSEHRAIVRWKRTGSDFLKGHYSREHTWTFDGGLTVPASPSPSIEPAPWSNAANIDPEEAFVAAVSSCHMLFYLMFAYQHGFQVDSYEDEAVGTMTKNERGILWISAIQLNPRVSYSGEKRPTPADEERLHHLSHDQCFIANSIKTQVTVGNLSEALAKGPPLPDTKMASMVSVQADE
jgi:organic hydroperoxide reductase OsmC/OhrA